MPEEKRYSAVQASLKPDRRTINFRGQGIVLYGVAILAPFLTTILALLHPRDPRSRNVIWIFTIFYGAVFYISATSGSDSVRYAFWLTDLNQRDIEFFDFLGLLYTTKTGWVDIYQPLMTYFVSLFTASYSVLFALFGVLLGYVYSRNVWFLIDRMPRPMHFLPAFLIIAFAMVISIGPALNGVRMYTALHVFVFAFLNYFISHKIRYLVVLLITPLIHFSFVLPCALFGFFLLVKRFGFGIYIFFLLSFLAQAIEIEVIKSIIGLLPMPIEDRAINYVKPLQIVHSAQAWFLELNKFLLPIFVVLASSWLVVRGALKNDSFVRTVLLFGMLIYGWTNLLPNISSSIRFYHLGVMLILAATVLFMANSSPQQRNNFGVIKLALPLLTINIALGIRSTLDFASVWLVVGNFFIGPNLGANVGVYEFFKNLLG